MKRKLNYANILCLCAVMAAFAFPATVLSAKPLKVFILAGQSNMVGQGELTKTGYKGTLEYMVDNDTDGTFAHLVDNAGDWVVRDDVWIWYNNGSAPIKGGLSVGYGSSRTTIGPEMQFGHVIGDFFDDQVLLIKIAWGGKSLAVDFRPPSSGGNVGPYYTDILDYIAAFRADPASFYPDYDSQEGYEIMGFGWHQGWNDRVNQTYNDEYEYNMANFIRDIRKDLVVPEMPFVIATTGMTGWDDTHPRALSLMAAQLAMADTAKYPEFKGNVAVIDTRDFWRTVAESPADQGYHWNRNAETYFLIGNAMAEEMAAILIDPPSFISDPIVKSAATEGRAYSGNVADTVVNDPVGGAPTFAKVAGPAWLTIASDGTLGGTPANGDVGQNSFRVRAKKGPTFTEAILKIEVVNTYNGTMGLEDLVELTRHWLDTDCTDDPACGGVDMDGDQGVTFADFSVIANNWQTEIIPGLKSHWRMDDTTGNILRDNYGSHDGELVNMDNSSWVPAVSGNGLVFDAAGGQVNLPTISLSGNWTICFWSQPGLISPDAPLGSMVMGNKDDENNFISMADSSGVMYESNTGDGVQWATDADFYQRWRHVSLVASGSQIELYLDGISQGTRPADTAFDLNCLGMGNSTAADGFTGRLDEVRIYDVALERSEIIEQITNDTLLAGHWTFDETTGTSATDSSGHGYDGQVLNGGVWQPTGGQIGGAIELDGVDDEVTLPAEILDPTEPFSVFMWVRLDEKLGSQAQVLLQHDGIGRTFLYRQTADDKLCSYFGGIQTVSASAVFDTTGQWLHIGMTYDKTTLKMYVDGQLEASRAVAGEPASAPFIVGAFKAGANKAERANWNGLIDEIRVYNRALTTSDIQELITPLRGHWKFDDTTGTTATDSSVYGHNGNVANGGIWQPTAGKIGGALELDGIDDEITLPASILDPTESFSVVMWVKLDKKLGSISQTLLQHDGTGRSFLYRQAADEKLCSYFGGIQTVSASAVFDTTGHWLHIGITYDKMTLMMYVDGQLEASRAVAGEPASAPFIVGAFKAGFDKAERANWDGLIDEMRVYSRALTQSEITALASE